MKLSISKSEWNVLYRQLCNSINHFKAEEIIKTHKSILEKFKEKIKNLKEKAVEIFKKDIEKTKIRNKEDKILKFETEQEEELENKFRNRFYKMAQDIQGKI